MSDLDDKPLKGKVALITGGGCRLGRAFTEALIKLGADVAVHYNISMHDTESIVILAEANNVRSQTFQADFINPDKCINLFDAVINRFDRCDILINNASIFEEKPLETTDLETWERHLSVNLTAPFILSKQFARYNTGNKGSILNILDWRVNLSDRKHFAYSVSKSALVSLTKNLARSLAPNIRVNGLALGAILPPVEGSWNEKAILNKVPMKRLGIIEEVVQTMEFIITGPEYLAGEIIYLDGGRSLI